MKKGNLELRKFPEHLQLNTKWARFLFPFFIAAILLTLYLLTLKAFASNLDSPPDVQFKTFAKTNTSNSLISLNSENGLMDTAKSPRFWEKPLKTANFAVLTDKQFLRPGPDDEVRLILQLHKVPVAQFIDQKYGEWDDLSTSEIAIIQDYANELDGVRSQVLEQVKNLGLDVKVNHEFDFVFHGIALSTQMRNWQRLQQLSQVKAVYPDYEVKAYLNESVPLIGAPQLWQIKDANGDSVTGKGIRVAIIDTGIDYTHPDLGGCLGSACKVVGGYDFVNQDNDPMDDNGHGTHVAGIVAANGNLKGVAPDAKLYAYKALDAYGSGWDSAIIAAIELATDPDGNPATNDAVDVINMSLGGWGNPDDPLSQAVDNAVDLGTTIAVAAGNSGPYYQSIDSPGVARKALTVAASRKNDLIADFGSRGPIPGFFDVLKPDITAPGVVISSTVPVSGEISSPDRYLYLSGTSMATPHIAGAAALIKQLHPTWTPDMIKANLMNTAKDLGAAVYEQGAGRVQIAEAASSPLITIPGSISFGLPLIDETTSAQLALINISNSAIDVSAAVETMLWDEGSLSPLTTTVPVDYVSLSESDISISSGETYSITLSLDIPIDAQEGYYIGKVMLQGNGYSLSIPFTFTLLSKLTVHILEEEGDEWSDKWNNFVTIIRIPEIDNMHNNLSDWAVPATFYIPSGTYNIHGFGRLNVYSHWRTPRPGQQEKPLILAKTVDLSSNLNADAYLDGSMAHQFTLDTKTFSGNPLLVSNWGASFNYQKDDKMYITGVSWGDGEGYSTEFLKLLPDNLNYFVSDTPSNVSFDFFSKGFGYSTRLQNFVSLNSEKWYERPNEESGIPLAHNADEVYLYSWQLPSIDASSPNIFAHTPNGVSTYHVNYDFPGTMDDPWLGDGYFNISGADAMFYLPLESGALVNPISAGLMRDIYVKGAFWYLYWPDNLWNNNLVSREFFIRDWTKSFPLPWDTNVIFPYWWALKPLPPQEKTINLGAGPLYPSLIFDNDETMIRLLHPLLSSSHGNKVTWGGDPQVAIYKDGALENIIEMREYRSFISPLRQIPVNEPGNYELVITTTNDVQVAYSNIIQTGFSIPSSDMNPPYIIALDMTQRLTPNFPIAIDLFIVDDESGISDVELYYSTNQGTTWTSYPFTQEGGKYTASINPGNADSISLKYKATDQSGNYLLYTAIDSAIKETKVILTLNSSLDK